MCAPGRTRLGELGGGGRADVKSIRYPKLGLYVNLDPAAEDFDFEPDVDIKDLISLDDAMQEMQLGPNGAMIACFE